MASEVDNASSFLFGSFVIAVIMKNLSHFFLRIFIINEWQICPLYTRTLLEEIYSTFPLNVSKCVYWILMIFCSNIIVLASCLTSKMFLDVEKEGNEGNPPPPNNFPEKSPLTFSKCAFQLFLKQLSKCNFYFPLAIFLYPICVLIHLLVSWSIQKHLLL